MIRSMAATDDPPPVERWIERQVSLRVISFDDACKLYRHAKRNMPASMSQEARACSFRRVARMLNLPEHIAETL